MSRLALYLLDYPRVELNGKAVHIDRRKAVALLAYLAVTGCEHSRDLLATLLWPEYDQRSARTDLSRTLSVLTRAVGAEWFSADRDAIGMSAEHTHWLDVTEFSQRLVTCDAHAHDHPAGQECAACLARLREADALYKSDFMSGFSLRDSLAFDEWQRFRTARLRDELAVVLRRLTDCHRARGETEPAIVTAQRWVALDPSHEPAHRTLMALYAAAGRRETALRQYRECVGVLEAELGMSPSAETEALYEGILTDLTGFRNVSGLSHNLPVETTPFIGRERELVDLVTLLLNPQVRLVTVVGAGGMGKTRLALKAAAANQGRGAFPDGVCLAELAPVAGPGAVGLAVAAALGAEPQPDRVLTDILIDALLTRGILLLLDNCEHLLQGVARLVGQLLARCPQLTVLATSREPLRLPGEYLYDVPPMTLSPADVAAERLLEADALRLFAERGAAVRPGFTVDEGNAGAVVEICRRLDGMPLAIELAAARLRALSPQEIAARLDDRFRLLTGGSRAALPRQQTLLNAVAWSYELLDEGERALFDRLSIFRGGFALQAAERVCAGDGVTEEEVLDLLLGLVDKSLVETRAVQTGDPTRYDLLETLRQYGTERLIERGEFDAISNRHARYCVALAEELEPQLSGWQDWAEAFRRLDAEADNLVAAMRWSLANDAPEIALRIGGANREWVWARPHRRQFQEWISRALEMGSVVPPAHRARALGTLGLPVWGGSSINQALELGEEALALAEEAGESRLVTRALYDVGRAAHGAGQHKRARAYFERCLAIASEQDDRVSTSEASIWLAMCHEPEERRVLLAGLLPEMPYILGANVLLELGWANFGLGNFPEAGVWFQGSFERWGEAGILPAQARASHGLAVVSMLLGHDDRALQHLEQCQELSRRSGNITWILTAARVQGELAWRRGDLETAARWLQESLDLAHERGVESHIAHVQRWRAYVLCSQGDFDQAAAAGTASLEGFEEGNHFGRGVATLALARVALFRGDAGHAVELFCAARLLSTQETWIDTIRAIEGLGWALAKVVMHREAAVLLGFVDRQRRTVRMVRPAVDRPYHEGVVTELRAALGEDAFAAAWAEGEGQILEVIRASQLNDI